MLGQAMISARLSPSMSARSPAEPPKKGTEEAPQAALLKLDDQWSLAIHHDDSLGQAVPVNVSGMDPAILDRPHRIASSLYTELHRV